MQSITNLAPLATLTAVAPSLDSLTSKRRMSCVVVFDNDEAEIKLDTSSDDEDSPNIPDGGYGWVIVVSSLMLCMICDGVSFSFGLLYSEFLIEFQTSKSATSWIGSLFMAVPLITGPIMSVLVDKYGCRSMTIAGGIISAFGFAISSKCNSIGLMYLTFGTIAGLGLGLCFVTMVVSVAFWFDKKRTLAVGLSSAGAGLGTFIFSPLTTFLIHEYGWRGTTLILAGCFLNMCVCGVLMRDPDWIIEEEKKKLKGIKASCSSLETLTSVKVDELKQILTHGNNVEFRLEKLETALDDKEDKAKLKKYFTSTPILPTYIKQDEKIPSEILKLLSNNKKLYHILVSSYPNLLVSRSCSIGNTINKEAELNQVISPDNHEPPPYESLLGHKDTKLPQTLSVLQLKQINYTPKHDTNLKNTIRKPSLVHRDDTSIKSFHIEKEEKWYSEIVELVKDMFDYSLFLELHFLLLSLSAITLFIWFIVPYFYLAELMSKHDYTTEDTSFTISNIGISNTIGLIVLGWAGDRPWLNISKTYAVCLVICGFSVGSMMWFIDNFILLELSAALFGLSLASSYSFTPTILMQLVPFERFTIAYGLKLLCMGIGILVGPPYAGLLFDKTGTWDQSFYQASVWLVISGLYVALIPYTKNIKIIGKGPVEKEIQGSKNNFTCIIVLLISMASLLVIALYLAVRSLL